jgi:hypothetical protein
LHWSRDWRKRLPISQCASHGHTVSHELLALCVDTEGISVVLKCDESISFLKWLIL